MRPEERGRDGEIGVDGRCGFPPCLYLVACRVVFGTVIFWQMRGLPATLAINKLRRGVLSIKDAAKGARYHQVVDEDGEFNPFRRRTRGGN